MKKEFQAGTADEQRTEADNSTSASVASKPNVSSRFKWKSISYSGKEPYTDTPPWTRIKDTSEDSDGNKIVTIWDENQTPKIQSFYNGKLVHSCNRNKSEFGRNFLDSYGYHREIIHREAEIIVSNGC